jgi:hypothetical protein
VRLLAGRMEQRNVIHAVVGNLGPLTPIRDARESCVALFIWKWSTEAMP